MTKKYFPQFILVRRLGHNAQEEFAIALADLDAKSQPIGGCSYGGRIFSSLGEKEILHLTSDWDDKKDKVLYYYSDDGQEFYCSESNKICISPNRFWMWFYHNGKNIDLESLKTEMTGNEHIVECHYYSGKVRTIVDNWMKETATRMSEHFMSLAKFYSLESPADDFF